MACHTRFTFYSSWTWNIANVGEYSLITWSCQDEIDDKPPFSLFGIAAP